MRTSDINISGQSTPLKNVSVIGLGCAAMLGRAGRRESLAALGAAYDAGITFYDTARSYGYGACEGLLGEFFSTGRRSSVVLCTKFGILPGNPGGWKQRVKPLARAVLGIVPQLRGMVRKHAADQFVPGQFSVATLRSSFETSLRELKTDYVDILLMHGPPAGALQDEDILEELRRLVDTGKVRLAGVSGEGDVIRTVFGQHSPVLQAAQFPMNPFSMHLASQTLDAAKSLMLIANHPFGGAEGIANCRTLIDRLRQDPAVPQPLREKLDARDQGLLPEFVLNSIIRDTGISVVIPSMMKPAHLHSNMRAIDQCRFSPSELQFIRHSLAANSQGH
ncbi:aldo/keto reductase [Telmatobacter sp. DSM 110680]|uniref:Aldo/keto reductase n=1 Tax=Telmatobacter sp. DSM 110680 TaxID=3036704 RepID=A0AAU7DJS9_9BACT